MSHYSVLLNPAAESYEETKAWIAKTKHRSSGREPCVKLLLNGPGNAGKTSAVMTFVNGKPPLEYTPTVFDNYSQNVTLSNGTEVSLGLWDQLNRVESYRLRPLSYPGTDVYCFCFSVADRDSLDSVANVLLPEVLQCYEWTGETPPALVLFGLKSDLRTDEEACKLIAERERTFVGEDEARKFAKKHNMTYFELSAYTDAKGVADAFMSAAQLGYESKFGKNSGKPKKSGGVFGLFKSLFR